MAVLRQQTQVFNKPIGVVRANAGASQVGEAVSRLAGTIAEEGFRYAGERAEAIGKKAGLSQSIDQVISIDPMTNMPVGYEAPPSFGTIATNAYQNMIDQRFQGSIQSELARKGAEFAASSSTANQYKTRLSNYVESMFNAEGEATPYSQYITEAGTAYVASTYSTLAKNEAEATRKKLILSRKVASFEGEQNLKHLILAGASSYRISDEIGKQLEDNQNLFDVGGKTFKEYTATIERVQGLKSMYANNELAGIYSGLTEIQQERFKIGLQEPSVINELAKELSIFNLRSLVIDAKTTTNLPTLVAGIEAFSSRVEKYEGLEASVIVDDLTKKITPMLTVSGVMALLADVDPNLRGQVREELLFSWITKSLDQVSLTSDSIDIITNALRNESGANYNDVAELIGGGNGRRISLELQDMSQTDRETLAKGIEDRNAALGRIESAEVSENEEQLRRVTRVLRDGDDLENTYKTIIKRIKSNKKIGETTRDTLLNNLQEIYADESLQRSQEIYLNLPDLERISGLLANPIGSELRDMFKIKRLKEAYGFLKSAYDLQPAATGSFIDDRITAIQNQNQTEIDEVRTLTIKNNIGQASKGDLEWYQTQTIGDTVIVASTMMQNITVRDTLKNGVVLPKVADAIENALNTLDEESLRSALGIFEQYTDTTKTVIGSGDVPLDLMRESLSPKAYAEYSSILYSAKELGIEPLAVAMQLRNYDGNIDADIKKDLGLGEGSNINKLFGEIDINPLFRREILSILRVRKAYDAKITEDTVETVIKSYTKGMRSDSRVIAPQVGDKTFYARRQYFGTEEIIRNREQLFDAMIQTGQHNHLLTGGTAFDAGVAQMGLLFGAELSLGMRAVMEQVGIGGELINRELVSDKVRTRGGLKILRTELAYRPVRQAFSEGEARYEVGYKTDLGTFQAIEINGQPWILEKNYATEKQSGLRFQAINALNVVNNSGGTMVQKAESSIRYFSTLDHVTEKMFLDSSELQGKFDKILGNGESIKLFRIHRKTYEELDQ